MTFTEELKLRRKDESHLYTAMYLNEVFDYFEEILCKPLSGGGEFTIHADDIKEGGKFAQFSGYSVKRFGQEFSCSVYLG